MMTWAGEGRHHVEDMGLMGQSSGEAPARAPEGNRGDPWYITSGSHIEDQLKAKVAVIQDKHAKPKCIADILNTLTPTTQNQNSICSTNEPLNECNPHAQANGGDRLPKWKQEPPLKCARWPKSKWHWRMQVLRSRAQSPMSSGCLVELRG
mmetsp:Transcript_108378/g.183581  ORF Transcript_108378/g.183581 Transcript_108378/m.183581 type:complete len:151 (+) Transcript_108378:88-540(+)